MSFRKAKTTPKVFLSDREKLKELVLGTLKRVSDIVGSTMGPNGRVVLLESDMPGVEDSITKDGVSVFQSLGASSAYEHAIIQMARSAAKRTSETAGDGPQPLESKVLTPNGFISMGEVTVGMEVCGINQTTQKVLGVFPKGFKEIYKVEFSDNRVVECCSEHLWQVTTNYGKEKLLTTANLLEDYKKIKNGYNNYKYYTPKTVVEFNEDKAKMPLDPYLVGLLLGDGSLSGTGSIELSLGKPKAHILEKIKLPEGLTLTTTFVENKNSYRVKINGKTKDGKSIFDIVEQIGLLGTLSKTKFIPKQYLFSSTESRKSLLQGLIDTDGHINVRDRFEFSTVSDSLFEDFLTLTNSLGISTHSAILERKKNSSYSETPIHRVTELKGDKFGNKITNITATGVHTLMQCIKVSNPDNLYITDNFIVTHNTTTATVLSYAIIEHLYAFCEKNPKYSPQKAVRFINKAVRELLVPYIRSRATKISIDENKELLHSVAKVSANGDSDIADAVIAAFEAVGFGEDSHVTIRQVTGDPSYEVSRIDGFPMPIGYEESLGRLHSTFINDNAQQRIVLEKPSFILFDGQLNSLDALYSLFEKMANAVTAGDESKKNCVLVAHSFSEAVLSALANNWTFDGATRVVALRTPMAQFLHSQTHALYDLAAFTGATVFGMKKPIQHASLESIGSGMQSIEIYRFRASIIGDPEAMNIEVRAEELSTQMKAAESLAEKSWLQERLGIITNGIARLTIHGGSFGELKEKHDRVEDAVLSCRSALAHGALPGGCRITIDMALLLMENLSEDNPAREVLIPALLMLPKRLLDNAGYNKEDSDKVIAQLIDKPEEVYNIETATFGNAFELGLFDSTKAVEESLVNAVSIASVLGTMGGIVVAPRDAAFEREEAGLDSLHIRNSSLGQDD
jgi:chaperonin GroEL (HSP60 family)